eukprot:gene11792-13752_t
MSIQLGNASTFGWFIIAIAIIMSIGIYIAYRKSEVIKWKYIIAVIIMLVVGVKWKALAIQPQEKTVATKNTVLNSEQDSITLLQLTKQVHQWSQNNDNDFIPLQKATSDTAYAGLDMTLQQQRLDGLRRTGLFAESFISNYNKIALAIDSKMKDGSLQWNIGDLPPFGNGTNPWCNCQDVPANFLNKIWIMRLNVKGNTASYAWAWGNGTGGDIKAVKENNQWKVMYMDGFDQQKFIDNLQSTNDFTGKWKNEMVVLNIGKTSMAFEYHGQCVYFYPIKKISDTEFEMIWARDMDCKFDNGTNETFGLTKVPQSGKPFAKFSLKNKVLYVRYYYKEWVEKYTKQVQDKVFTPEYLRKNEAE